MHDILQINLEEEYYFNESDGSHEDALVVYDAMGDKDKSFIDNGYDYVNMPERRVLYRHVEREDSTLLGIKGFIECTKESCNLERKGDCVNVIIGVHPRFRRQGIATDLVKTAIKEIKRDHPNVTSLHWVANRSNKASNDLAISLGFKLVKKADISNLYRYEIKKCKYLEDLDESIMNADDIIQFIMDKFKVSDDTYVDNCEVRQISNLNSTLIGNEFDRAMLMAAYFNKIALYNTIVCSEITRANGEKNYHFFNGTHYGKNNGIIDLSSEGPYIMTRDDFNHLADRYIHKYVKERYPNEEVQLRKSFIDLSDLVWQKHIKFNDFFTMVESATEEIEEQDIPHIPVPRVALTEGVGDTGYINEQDFIMDEDQICFFNVDAVLNEADSKYDKRIRQYLYKERIKTNNELVDIYNRAKELNPGIDRTYLKLSMYKRQNLFVDYSYYNGIFLDKLNLVKDYGVKFYWDFMNRLLEDSAEMKSLYNRHTIFIPVSLEAWKVPKGIDILDYKKTINPLSVIMRLGRMAPEELQSKWGNKTILFIGNKGYFTVDFNNFDMKQMGRFKRFIYKLIDNVDINDDEDEDGYETETETDSKSAMAISIVDKIEKSSGINIPNVSKAIKKSPEAANVYRISDVDTMRIRDYQIPIDTKSKNANTAIGIFAPTDRDISDLIGSSDMVINVRGINTIVVE